jgi:hypothetical protein
MIGLTDSEARPEILSELIGTRRRLVIVVAEMPRLLLDDGGSRYNLPTIENTAVKDISVQLYSLVLAIK